jgi:tripartite-type tricarboxylate transporter receptor subunit TctC
MKNGYEGRWSRVAIALFATAATSLSHGAQPDAWPARNITMIVPYASGGGADIVARTVSVRLGELLGQQVIVDNRAGAGGNLGAQVVAKAPADGYTIMLGTNTHATNASLYSKVPYDLVKDFAAIGLMTTTPLVLLVHPSLPVRNARELATLAKQRPQQLNYSSGGNGSTPHLAAELFKSVAKVDIVHVPHKAVAGAITDLMSGQVQVMFPSISSASPHMKSGRVRALAVTGAKRSSGSPELPTMMESGFPDYEVSIWNALFAPAGTPQAIVARINTELTKVVHSADIRERFTNVGVEPITSSSQELAAYVKLELDRWGKLVRETGARID